MSEEDVTKEAVERPKATYAAPDMIDIVVSDPTDILDEEGKQLYTTFLVTVHTNLDTYKSGNFSVRRRYSEFERLRAHLVLRVSNNAKTKGSLKRVPELPGKKFFGKFEPAFLEERRQALEEFLNRVAGHAICRLEKGFHDFLQDQDLDVSTLAT